MAIRGTRKADRKGRDERSSREAVAEPLVDPCVDVEHVGVVFVHGIGSQPEGETLRDWSGPIIRVIADIRVAAGKSGDPVVRTSQDRRASGNRDIEIEVPQPGDKVVHWIMTEAWWAADVASPSFSTMVDWLGPSGTLRQVAETFLPSSRSSGIQARFRSALQSDILDGRTGELEAGVPGVPADTTATTQAPPTRQSMGARVGTQLSMVRRGLRKGSKPASKVVLGAALQAFATLVLVFYAALRGIERLIPIGPLKDRALTKGIDTFMLEWFGDVFILLGDPAQAAGIRMRVISALEILNERGCKRVVVLAHSGGAIVSYMTLSDPLTKALKVDRLITHGEGLNLARRIALGSTTGDARAEASRRYEALFRSLREAHPDLHWNDFWASQDPAPVGPIRNDWFESGELRTTDRTIDQPRIESLAVWNRGALLEDHGGYWDNDEEFLIPLLRRIDGEDLTGETSTFFTDAPARTAASAGRRRRLAVLSLWRQVVSVAGISALAFNFIARRDFVDTVGASLYDLAGSIPGDEIISGPLNLIRGALIGAPAVELLSLVGTVMLVGVVGLMLVSPLIDPPERAAAWRGGRFGEAIDAGLLVVRVAIFVLLALAVVEWVFHIGLPDFANGSVELLPFLPTLLGVGIGLPLLAFGAYELYGFVVRQLERSRLLRMSGVIVLMFLALAALIALGLAIVMSIPVRQGLLAVLLVLAAGSVIQSIGVSRWDAWDRRARVRARRGIPDPGATRIVAAQGVLLLACLGSFWLIVASDAFGWWLVPVLLGALAVLVGVAVDTSPPDEINPGGQVVTYQDAASAR